MLKGFKEFIARGNVVEMAVGIIIGGAFKNIVDALVNGVINPLIAASVGKPDFSKAFIVTFHGTDITFGVLLTAVINFLIMAFALYFFLVLPMNYLAKRTKKAEDEAPKEVSEEVQLLTEIRDALAKGDPLPPPPPGGGPPPPRPPAFLYHRDTAQRRAPNFACNSATRTFSHPDKR